MLRPKKQKVYRSILDVFYLLKLNMWNLNAYIFFILFFHSTEFLCAFIYMRNELSLSSFLVSKPYLMAMSFSMLEFFAEWYFFPVFKTRSAWIAYIGVFIIVLGEGIRKLALFTAKANFTHIIRTSKQENHFLVTNGIYSVIRHPGYLGWFLWCLGTQILLVNPLSLVGFYVVTWRFFNQRISYEERLLRRFFGDSYLIYASRTPTYIPYIP